MSLMFRARARCAVAAAFPFIGLGSSPGLLAQPQSAGALETVVVTATRTP